MTLNAREILRRTFDEAAPLYDRARPGYPEALFDDLFVLAGLGRPPRVLEVGCGTGQATLPLARRGSAILCVELGARLAAFTREKLAAFPDVEIEVAPFEAWDPAGRRFDVVFAASSWHWIDPDVRHVKAARVLAPSGSLAIVSHEGQPEEPPDPFAARLRECFRRVVQPPPPSRPRGGLGARDAIEQSGLFSAVETRRYAWTQEYTADEYVDLLSTHSRYLAADASRRAEFFEEVRRLVGGLPGGRISRQHTRALHVARVIAAPP